jgi:aspartate/tyrosine/aromatic aminotransferase
VLQIYSNIFAFTERFFLINLVVGILQNEKSRSGDIKVVNTNSTYAPPTCNGSTYLTITLIVGFGYTYSYLYFLRYNPRRDCL